MNLLLTTYEKKRFLSGTCGGVEGGKDVFKTSVLVLRIFLYITVDSLYLEHPLSRTSLYLELKSQSLCVSCNLFFSLYLELSLSRTNFLVPCEFAIERINCSTFFLYTVEVFLYTVMPRLSAPID